MGEEQHQYGGIPVLRQLAGGGGGGGNFHGNPEGTNLFFGQSRNLSLQTHPYDPIIPTSSSHHHEVMLPCSSGGGGGFVKLGLHDHYNYSNATDSSSGGGGGHGASFYGGGGLELMESSSCWVGNERGIHNSHNNSSRWPRQETLTLLEIRSRLDSRFKEANQKGPLWDELSRIMADEHGYQRSGKKCREKFENLYKYYKKTKEGKAGRQDGKHYRFFRQLEALYGETLNNNQPNSSSETQFLTSNPLLFQTPSNAVNQDQSLSLSNTSELETSSSENNDDDLSAIAYMMNKSRGKQKGVISTVKKASKSKVKDYVDFQMRKLMETQEAWMEKMLKTIEDREQERVSREEEWKKQEAARLDREVHEFWAKERGWVAARDAALMETLGKYTGKGELSAMVEQITLAKQRHTKIEDEINISRWKEAEILSLIEVKTTVEQRFQQNGYSKEGIWKEIAAKMSSFGYERRPEECQEKWENMNIYFNMTESSKKRKEDFRRSSYLQEMESNCGDDHLNYVSNHHQMQGFQHQFPMNEGEQHLYGLKLSNENYNQHHL